MVDNLTLSPAGLALLEMLEQQTGVSFEVVHLWLDPVRQSASGDFAQRMEEPEVAEEVLKALRTGEVRVAQVKGATFGVFPLRRVREVVGCLVASQRVPADETSSVAVRTMEEAGALARGILESDLQVNGQLAASQALTRRLHATLRFLGQLGTYESDRDVMHAVLHAATVWFDLECRIYSRRPDGRFVLSGALPGVEQAGQPLEAERAAQLVAARRFPPAGELDDLGFSGRKDEVLVLPVGIGEPAWLILLAGSLDSNVELTFGAIARVLTGDLQARELARLERWQNRLTLLPSSTRAMPERALTELLEELVREAGAESAKMTVADRGAPAAARLRRSRDILISRRRRIRRSGSTLGDDPGFARYVNRSHTRRDGAARTWRRGARTDVGQGASPLAGRSCAGRLETPGGRSRFGDRGLRAAYSRGGRARQAIQPWARTGLDWSWRAAFPCPNGFRHGCRGGAPGVEGI